MGARWSVCVCVCVYERESTYVNSCGRVSVYVFVCTCFRVKHVLWMPSRQACSDRVSKRVTCVYVFLNVCLYVYGFVVCL